MSWPVADLDTIRRLRILATAVPGAVVAETLIDASFEQTWAVAADLERELPRYLVDVRSVRITRREAAADAGERLEAYFRGYAGLRGRFDIVLRPGWCVMRSRFLLGGMAAVSEGERTRFAFLGGVHVPAQGVAAPVLTAIGRATLPRVVDRLGDRVQRRRSGPDPSAGDSHP